MEKTEILALFNERFGTSVDRRLVKLREEYGELMEAAEKDILKNKDNLDDFIDELADLNAVVFHIAGILGLTQDELLSMSADKVVGRMKDPNYKRKHPHTEHSISNDKYLSIVDVCQYLKVGRTTVWRYTKMGILKPRKIGCKILFDRADIDKYLTKSEQ